MENRPGSFMFASAPLSERPFRHSLYIYCKRNSIFGNVIEKFFEKEKKNMTKLIIALPAPYKKVKKIKKKTINSVKRNKNVLTKSMGGGKFKQNSSV